MKTRTKLGLVGLALLMAGCVTNYAPKNQGLTSVIEYHIQLRDYCSRRSAARNDPELGDYCKKTARLNPETGELEMPHYPKPPINNP
ncbi:MAG: hypothetical protein ABIH49_00655 [archaeon]